MNNRIIIAYFRLIDKIESKHFEINKIMIYKTFSLNEFCQYFPTLVSPYHIHFVSYKYN